MHCALRCIMTGTFCVMTNENGVTTDALRCIVMTGHTLMSVCPAYVLIFVSFTTLFLHHHVPCSARVRPLSTFTLAFEQSSACLHSSFCLIVYCTCHFKYVLCSVVYVQYTCWQCRAVHARSLIYCHPIAPVILYHTTIL